MAEDLRHKDDVWNPGDSGQSGHHAPWGDHSVIWAESVFHNCHCASPNSPPQPGMRKTGWWLPWTERTVAAASGRTKSI